MSYFPGSGAHQQGQNQQQQYYPQGQPPQGGYYQPQNPQPYYSPPNQYGSPPPQQYQQPPPQQYGNYGPPGGAYPPPQQQGYNNYGGPPPPQGGYYPPNAQHVQHQNNNWGHTEGPRPPMASYQDNSWNRGNHSAPPPPPSGAQSFAPGFEQYKWVPSKCTGRRKALLIGINYFNQRGQLRGCINDVKNMTTFLNERYGYAKEDMVILTDDQQNPRSQPTKANILQAMHWLVRDARPDDSLFFHYSGHGGQQKDTDGDEDDGYDETIYPVDFRTAGMIVDDEMHRIMVTSLQPGVRLTAIFDSCHSGSALDLPYLYSTKGVLKEPNLAKEAANGLLGAFAAYNKDGLSGMASTLGGFIKKAKNSSSADTISKRTKTSPADVVQWSGSKDVQTSADTVEGGEATGAMSYAFINALKKNGQQSYQELLVNIRDELEGKYDQKPQLSCSHPLDTRTLYVM
ncbi:metacaspase-1A [Drechslerella stenobrocha 248]|uniref:Metacaspase-1A n=1 Tax=Drechslerella stenobrocha 248 TaxID=1043628 RepID=W7HZA0_9PEZI|nr:metacaspase-1A [Drechslerella stenobrocha 248]